MTFILIYKLLSFAVEPSPKSAGRGSAKTRTLPRPVILTLAAVLFILQSVGCFISDSAFAQETPEYHTPLAGEQCDIECFGRKYALPPRNRDNTTALVLGGSFFAPDLAGHAFIPIGALYYKHRYDDIRVRGTFSIFVNEMDVSRNQGHFQLLGHLDNETIPFDRSEIDSGNDVEGTAIRWGTVNGRLGAGWRRPVSPYQIDNDLRVQFYYQLGYLYSKRVTDTAPNVILPPNTLVHGPLVRVRYDGLHRNLMELPHSGVAAGMDAGFQHRDEWSDANYGGALFTKAQTQDYLKLSAYISVATGLPFLSEKNRLLTTIYGGFAPYGTLDRFSAFRIGGGPIPSETDDLDRRVFPGAMFSQFPVSDYLIGGLEYRREIYSFLYLHLRGTYGWVRRENFTDNSRNFDEQNGEAYTVGLTSGFFWRSELHLDYTFDSKILRSGNQGSNVILLWSKSF